MAVVINVSPEIQNEFRRVSKFQVKDGRSYHPKYSVYKGMLDRCYNENHSAYKWYGGDGVTVCDEWLDPIEGFWRFAEWHDATIPAGYSMDKDNDLKLYSPTTVKPALQVEQVLRTRSIKAHNTSGTQGVRFHKGTRRWSCNMDVYRNKCFIGNYDTQEDAQSVYNDIYIFRLNNPEDKDGVMELIEFYRSERESSELHKKKVSTWRENLQFVCESETWKEYPGYPNYAISSEGRVYSFNTQSLMKPNKSNKDGLLSLGFKYKTNSKRFRISRLVAELFLENPENKKMVSYKDGNQSNCSATNLEWVTHKELMQKAVDKGTYFHFGAKGSNAKLTDDEVEYIRSHYKKGDREFNAVKLSEKFGVCSSTVYNIIDKFTFKDKLSEQ